MLNLINCYKMKHFIRKLTFIWGILVVLGLFCSVSWAFYSLCPLISPCNSSKSLALREIPICLVERLGGFLMHSPAVWAWLALILQTKSICMNVCSSLKLNLAGDLSASKLIWLCFNPSFLALINTFAMAKPAPWAGRASLERIIRADRKGKRRTEPEERRPVRPRPFKSALIMRESEARVTLISPATNMEGYCE